MELHHVRHPEDAKPMRNESHCRRLSKSSPRFAFPFVHALMQYPPGSGQAILRPGLLKVDKRTLPPTEQVVLQSGEHDERFV
jgi:hypothetical protein